MIARKVAWMTSAAVLAIGAAGCAATGEREARTAWQDVWRQLPPPEESATRSGPGTLAEVLDEAERRSPALRSRLLAWRAALDRVPAARALPDPRLSYTYMIEEVETRVGPQRQRIGLSQTLPLFGKLGLRGDVALEEANAAGARYEADRLALRQRIGAAWSDYYYLGRAIAVTDEMVRLMTYLESVARNRYTSGATPYAAVMQAQVELGRLEDRLRSLHDQAAPILARLNAELDRPAGSPIAWPDTLVLPAAVRSVEELSQVLIERNPELAAATAMEARAAKARTLAGRDAIPDLTVGAEVIDTGGARMPGVMDSGKDPVMATVSINLPLWFGKYRALERSASAELSAAGSAREQKQNELLSRLEATHFRYRDAERKIDLYQHSLVPRARQSFEVTEDTFVAGKADFLDLVEAQRTLLEFELSLERARADVATSVAELEMLVGTSPSGELR